MPFPTPPRASRLTQRLRPIRLLETPEFYERNRQADRHHFCPPRKAPLQAAQGIQRKSPHKVLGPISQALQRIRQDPGQVLGQTGKERTGLVQTVEKGAAVE